MLVAAKQAAFEEQSKVRNQFRALDDDEIDFLDEVRQKKRMEEERVRRETEEGLQAFRDRQLKKDGDEGAGDDTAAAATASGTGEVLEENWGVGRKRKRVKDKDIKGVRRRVSNEDEGATKDRGASKEEPDITTTSAGEAEKLSQSHVDKAEPKKPSLGLVDYGSDDSD